VRPRTYESSRLRAEALRFYEGALEEAAWATNDLDAARDWDWVGDWDRAWRYAQSAAHHASLARECMAQARTALRTARAEERRAEEKRRAA